MRWFILIITSLSTVYQPLGSYQLTGNYLTNALAFQLAGNYLTNASAFQLAGNYVTSGSLSAYQTVANMGNYITSGSLTTYITSGSLTAYAPIASPSFTGAPKINTYDVALKPWVCFRYTAGVVANYGVATISSVNSNSNNGAFDVVFTPAHPSGTNYGLLATCRNAGGAANYVQSFLTSTGFRITTYALSTGTQTAYDFCVMSIQ